MEKIGIIITDPEDWTAKALINAASSRNMKPIPINLKTTEVAIDSDITYMASGLNLKDLDAIVVRDVGGGTMEGVALRFDILRQLENEGITIVNSPAAIQNAANKYYSTCLLANAGIPVPRTRAVQNIDAALDTLAEFGDSVIKPVFGYKGIGIIRIKDEKVIESDGVEQDITVEQKLSDLLDEKGMLYIQQFIANPGRDIRAFVVDGEVAGAIYRTAPPGSWINNLSQGGSAGQCVLTAEQEEICIKAAKAIGAVFAGVDIIESNEGPMVLEINGTPSGAGIHSAWGIDCTDRIINYITTII